MGRPDALWGWWRRKSQQRATETHRSAISKSLLHAYLHCMLLHIAHNSYYYYCQLISEFVFHKRYCYILFSGKINTFYCTCSPMGFRQTLPRQNLTMTNPTTKKPFHKSPRTTKPSLTKPVCDKTPLLRRRQMSSTQHQCRCRPSSRALKQTSVASSCRRQWSLALWTQCRPSYCVSMSICLRRM